MRPSLGWVGVGGRGGRCRQNETKKNERKPKSRLLMTKTLVEVRRPAQCAYACTNKESRHIHTYIHTYINTYICIYLLYIVHIYIHLHTSLYVCVLHGELPFLLPQNARAALRLCPPPAAAHARSPHPLPVPGVDLILVTSFGPSLLEHSFVRSFVLRVQCGKWGRFQVLRRTPAACCLPPAARLAQW